MRNFVVIFILFVQIAGFSSLLSAKTRADTTVGAVMFEGVTVFGPDRLGPASRSSVGRKWNAETRALVTKQTRSLYLENGFLEPRVSASAYSDFPGVIIVSVVEPALASIEIVGVDVGKRRAVRAALEPLKQRQPISLELIKSSLRRIEKTHGLVFEAELEAEPGRAGRYHLTLVSSSQLRGALTYSAEGSRRFGRHLVFGRAILANPNKYLRSVGVSALHTLESDAYRVVGADLEAPVSKSSSLSLAVKVGRGLLKDQASGSETVYRLQQYEGEWEYALARTQNTESEVFVGLEAREFTRTEQADRELDEQLRMGELGYRRLARAASSAFRFRLTGQFGFDALGARRRGSQADDAIDLSFQIARADYTYWRTLPAGLSLKMLVEGQYTEDDLPGSQRFYIGGSQFARAYEPGAFSGDRGAGTELELRRRIARPWGLPAQVTPYIYYGLATAYKIQTSSQISGAAAGLGLRFSADSLSGYLEVGEPLTTESGATDDDSRITGRLTLSF